ncbi:hypothetical protein EYF80_039157 [Liparis tanakae]|uniref:Uncharacterized protein n=1 Tax=Liparis tanakae TaxID=230148 RepID=A0A4Z2GD57_9TELE|nr:hypothetical protein EYF80_039157 [Liparis tanakae]
MLRQYRKPRRGSICVYPAVSEPCNLKTPPSNHHFPAGPHPSLWAEASLELLTTSSGHQQCHVGFGRPEARDVKPCERP